MCSRMVEKRKSTAPVEMIFWSVALPGFGQLLNHQFLKAALLILLEFLINVLGNINLAIVHSFQGRIDLAIQVVDYRWIMFYPCLYVFAIWDAYITAKRMAKLPDQPFESIPFAFAAYIITIGVIFSNKPILGVTFGPIFTPIMSLFVGFFLGGILRKILLKKFT